MPTIEQIRAARALLDWSQAELAERSGLSQTGIARIENGTNKPNTSTLEKIESAFDQANIEFIASSGVKKRTDEIRTFYDTEGFKLLMDDVYKTALEKGGNIRVFNGVPSLFLRWLGKEWYEMHAERMMAIKDKFDFKIIIEEGDKLRIAHEFAQYRWFPRVLFHNKSFYAYGNKLAFLDFSEKSLKIRVLEEKDFTESFRILFDIAWDSIAQIPPAK